MNTTTNPTAPAAQVAAATLVQSYLNFDGRCEEALDFYGRVLGAEVTHLIRFKDGPGGGQCPPAVSGDKIMHVSFRIGETILMASDCDCEGKPGFKGISLALTVPDDATAERFFASLSEGGQVRQPLISTFFASKFGVVADRFGVCWMIVANPTTA